MTASERSLECAWRWIESGCLFADPKLWPPWGGGSTVQQTSGSIMLLVKKSPDILTLDPVVKILWINSFSHCLPALWHHGSLMSAEPNTHVREQSYLCSGTNSPDTRRERLSNERRANTGSLTPHSMCVCQCVLFFCGWRDVCVCVCVCSREESVQHNGVLQCGRPHPSLRAPLHGLLFGPLKLPWRDFKRKGQKREGVERGSGHTGMKSLIYSVCVSVCVFKSRKKRVG